MPYDCVSFGPQPPWPRCAHRYTPATPCARPSTVCAQSLWVRCLLRALGYRPWTAICQACSRTHVGTRTWCKRVPQWGWSCWRPSPCRRTLMPSSPPKVPCRLAQFSRRIWAQANRNRAGLSSCRGSSASLRVIDVSPPSKQINLSKRGIKRDQSSGDYSILSNVSNGGSQTHSRQALRLHGAVSAPTTPKFQAASRGLCHATRLRHGARP